MGDSGAPSPTPSVTQILIRQLLVLTGVSAAAFVFGSGTGYSAFMGGLVSLISNGYFAIKVLRGDGGERAGGGLARLYWAELVKVAMAAVLLASVFVISEDINPIALVLGFLLTQVTAAILTPAAATTRAARAATRE